VAVRVSDELGDLFYNALLAEVSTIDKDGTPIITPMQHAWIAERQNFILSSALGVRYKLDRIYRNPKIALSITDFTGSGLKSPTPVLIQATAQITNPATHIVGLEEFWSSNLRKKPDQRVDAFDKELRLDGRALFYMRARIEVTVDRIHMMTGPAGAQTIRDVTSDPAAQVAALAEAAEQQPGTELADFLDEFHGNPGRPVLSFVDDRGFPFNLRCHADAAGPKRFRLRLPDSVAAALRDGQKACLIWHKHDEFLYSLSHVIVPGEVRQGADGWYLESTRKPVPNGVGPVDFEAALAYFEKNNNEYLRDYGLSFPELHWELLEELATEAERKYGKSQRGKMAGVLSSS
jgi:hypothetical protein